MIFTEENVYISQLDELSKRLFKVKGKINLDKNDLSYMLGSRYDSKLITVQSEGEDSQEFMTKFTSYLVSKPDMKKWKRMMLYFGYSPQHPLRMEDMAMINDFLTQSLDEFDVLWGIHENPDEVGLSAAVIYNYEQ